MGAELKLQSQMFQWAQNNVFKSRGRLFRIKNELDNHPRKNPLDIRKQLAENKATGILPGVADFGLLMPNGQTVWIEVKTDTGSQSRVQSTWQQHVQTFGHRYFLVRTLTEFQELLLRLLA